MTKKQKQILLILAALCVAAAIVWFQESDEEKYGIDSINKTEKIWIKCNNPDCGFYCEMNKKEYFRTVQKNTSMENMNGLLVCEKCGQRSICRAEKCEKCGEVFLWGLRSGDYADRCPKCGYSKTAALQK